MTRLPATSEIGNRILRAMPDEAYERILPQLEILDLARGQVVYKVDEPIDSCYFVDRGLISLVKTMQDGRTVEIGAVGIEGLAGSDALLGVETAVLESVVQIPATAFRVSCKIMREEMVRSEAVRSLIQNYARFVIAQLAQTAACNRLHSMEERCCRWLLIAHDSARAGTFPLTHEFLAMMLGVQRSGVSLVANALQRAGFIRYARGRVTIVDRVGLEKAACECYAAMRAQADALLGASQPH